MECREDFLCRVENRVVGGDCTDGSCNVSLHELGVDAVAEALGVVVCLVWLWVRVWGAVAVRH